MDIHVRQLRYFMELAKCLNFTKAAMNLYIAQPALSQQIADLEKQLGVTLFVRNSRSVALTAAVQILLDSCSDILTKMEIVHRQMLQAQSGFRGSLRIGYLGNFVEKLPPLLAAFRKEYPDISLDIVGGSLQEQKHMLHSGQIDISFARISYPEMNREDAPERMVLWQDDICILIHEDHPFIVSGCLDLNLLEREELLLPDDSSDPFYTRIVQDVCTEAGLNFSNRKFLKNIEAVLMQVNAGLGVSVLPSTVMTLVHHHVRTHPLKKDCIDFGALWMKDNENPSLPLFLDLVIKIFKAPPNA